MDVIRLEYFDRDCDRGYEQNHSGVLVVEAVDKHVVIAATSRQCDFGQISKASHYLHIYWLTVLKIKDLFVKDVWIISIDLKIDRFWLLLLQLLLFMFKFCNTFLKWFKSIWCQAYSNCCYCCCFIYFYFIFVYLQKFK